MPPYEYDPADDVTDLELIGGVEPLSTGLREYDPRWRDVFDHHAALIRSALGARALMVEHIGSTSVEGLVAKPIVDIALVVARIGAEHTYLPDLLAAGYELRTREPGHRLVRTPARDVHVHIYPVGAPAVDEYLLFRDRLREDSSDRALYGDLKRQLIARPWTDSNQYADAKSQVIGEIKERARASRPAESRFPPS